MKRVIVFVLLLTLLFSQLIFADTIVVDDEVKKIVTEGLTDVIKKAYLVHGEIKDFKVQIISKKSETKENGIDVKVSFKAKSKYKNYYDDPLIAGAYKRLSLNKDVKIENLAEEIAKNNKDIDLEFAREIEKLLVNKIAEVKANSETYIEINNEYKVFLNKDKKVSKIMGYTKKNRVLVAVEDVLPSTYEEIFEIGYNTIVPEIEKEVLTRREENRVAQDLIQAIKNAILSFFNKESNDPIGYDFLVDSIDAKEIVNFRMIEIPEEIKKMKVVVSDIINKDTLLLSLYPDSQITLNNIVLSIYNIKDKKNKILNIKFGNDEAFSVEATDDNYIVFTTTKDNWRHVSLFVYSIKADKLKKIIDYSVDKEDDSVIEYGNNNIVIDGDNIIFDDAYHDKNKKVHFDLLKYNYKTAKTEVIKKDAKNPFSYKGKLCYLTLDDKDAFTKVETIDKKIIADLLKSNSNIRSTQESIYCIDDSAKNGKAQLFDLVNNRVLFETNRSVAWVESSDYFVTWSEYEEIEPFIYSSKDNKMVLFNDVFKGLNHFHLKDNYGVILNKVNGVNNYYYFERR